MVVSIAESLSSGAVSFWQAVRDNPQRMTAAAINFLLIIQVH